MAQAACRGMDTNVFFPSESNDATKHEAKRICSRCPVTRDCAVHALRSGSDAGIWGGLTHRERRSIGTVAKLDEMDYQGHGDNPGTVTGFWRELRSTGKPCKPCADAYNYSYFRSIEWLKRKRAT